MQAIELAMGELPREYDSWDEVQGWHRGLLPTPTSQLNAPSPWREDVPWWLQARAARNLEGVVTGNTPLLPTPKANDGKGATITHGRTRPDGRPYGAGDANLPLRVVELLPTPVAGEARHGSPNQHRTRGDTMLTGEILGLLPEAELTGRREELLRTPGGYAGERGGPQSAAKRKAGGHSVNLEDQVYDLLPTPVASEGERGSKTYSRGNPTLRGALLPTPSVSDGSGGHINRSGDRRGELLLGGLVRDMEVEWGAYEPAIRRWEALCGVPAPCPVEPGTKGRPRLAPAFVEWMMGLPAGWVTAVEGLSRGQQLKLLGNGVVPQQVIRALRVLCAKLTLEQ
jgi:hypothetical protein